MRRSTTIPAAVLTAALLALAAAGGRAAELGETDLAALRYFLSIDDKAAVAAEMQRLETEFPGADVDAAVALIEGRGGEIDTSPIWRRIDAGEFAAARALIAETQAAEADWTPPADLLAVLDGNEGQAKFETAFAAQDLDGAVAALAAHPAILTCDRINNPWRLAELQIARELKAEALATHEGILQACSEADHVVATLQKASAIAAPEQLTALLALARGRSPALAPRLAELEAELLPRAGAATASAAAAPATGSGGGGGGGGGGSARTGDASGDASGGAQATRARAAADRGDWAACLELTRGASTLDLVNQRGWCAYNLGRPREAIADFRRVAQSSRSGETARDATYGMILAYAGVGDLQQAAALAAQAQLTARQRQVVNKTVVAKLAVSSFEAGRYRASLDYLDRLSRETGTLDRGLAMLRGWALLKSGDKRSAREQFSRVHQTSPGSDSLSGLRESR